MLDYKTAISKNKLVGKRIILKKIKPSIKSARIIFKLVNDNRKHITPWLHWVKKTKKIEDSYKFLIDTEKKIKSEKEMLYGIYLNTEHIGNISIFHINKKNKSAEIGYFLSSKFIKKGYTSEAVKILEKEFFNNLNLNRIQIQCDKKNIASAKLAKKCGYKLEGTLRQNNYNEYFKKFMDTLMFSKLKSEFEKQK